MNTQKPEKISQYAKQTLAVVDVWSTIQGEGPFAGQRAVFVRLAGCNLACPHCDTDYTSTRQVLSVSEVVRRISETWRSGLPSGRIVEPMLVVVTGGEPFRQPKAVVELVDLLKQSDLRILVQIETNGTLPVPSRLSAALVISPKTGFIHQSILDSRVARFFKYVIPKEPSSEPDGLPVSALGRGGKTLLARPPAGVRIYVQPQEYPNPEHTAQATEQAVRLVMEHGYQLSLQTHKILGLK